MGRGKVTWWPGSFQRKPVSTELARHLSLAGSSAPSTLSFTSLSALARKLPMLRHTGEELVCGRRPPCTGDSIHTQCKRWLYVDRAEQHCLSQQAGNFEVLLSKAVQDTGAFPDTFHRQAQASTYCCVQFTCQSGESGSKTSVWFTFSWRKRTTCFVLCSFH